MGRTGVRNRVAVGDVTALVQQVHRALAELGNPPLTPEAEKTAPAVSVRASVKPDYLVCLKCAKKQKTLRRHIGVSHGLTPEQYRAEFGLPASYPMVAANYSERRRIMAHAIGLGRKGRGRPKADVGQDSSVPTPAPKTRKRKPKIAESAQSEV